MLPNEVLHEILRCMSRRFLDSFEIASRRLNALINAQLDELPLRPVCMIVRSDDFVRFNDTHTLVTVAFDDLGAVLRGVFVHRANIPALDEALFEKLLPHAACLRDAVCRVPWNFASQELVTRAFAELFFAREIHLDDRLCVAGSGDFWGYTGNFVELPCVQHCRLLGLGSADLLLRIRDQLIHWLSSGGPKKTFSVRIDVPTPPGYLLGLARLMLRTIRVSVAAAQFELIVIALRDVEQSFSEYPSMNVTNERTGEMLSVKSEKIVDSGQDYVRVSYNRRPQALHDP
ncbi:hypothetical protein AAVH_20398 [Aphelenchoides avenae]|nr:hypothetical protein AAVH_20398 [Aphelenchus avenae]